MNVPLEGGKKAYVVHLSKHWESQVQPKQAHGNCTGGGRQQVLHQCWQISSLNDGGQVLS